MYWEAGRAGRLRCFGDTPESSRHRFVPRRQGLLEKFATATPFLQRRSGMNRDILRKRTSVGRRQAGAITYVRYASLRKVAFTIVTSSIGTSL